MKCANLVGDGVVSGVAGRRSAPPATQRVDVFVPVEQLQCGGVELVDLVWVVADGKGHRLREDVVLKLRVVEEGLEREDLTAEGKLTGAGAGASRRWPLASSPR